MKASNQNFKSVEFMRKRRTELSELHIKNPNAYKKQLEAIRKKYASKFKKQKVHA